MEGHKNDLERLLRSLGDEGSQQQEALLFVNPPVPDVDAIMMQHQQAGLPTFTDEFLNPLAVPSPTAEWHNFISMNNDPLASSSAAAPFATSTGLLFQHFQRDFLSAEPTGDFPNSAWGFADNETTPKIGNFPGNSQINLDAIQGLLNTPISSIQGSRTSQFLGHQVSGHQQQLARDPEYDMRASPSQMQFRSPFPPSAVGSLSPVMTSPSRSINHGRRSPSPARLPNSGASTQPNTPNSSVSSGSFSDGPEGAAAGPSASTSKRKTPDRAMDENEEIQSPELKKPSNKPRKKGSKRVREPRYAIQTRSDVEIMEDGYKWRKYGQKAVKNSPHPRSYYRCTALQCPVRKRVERSAEDTGLVITTYEGTHTHVSPAATNSGTRASSSDAPPLLPASGENRPGGAAYQPSASSFPFTPSINPLLPSRSNYDLTVQIQSATPRDYESTTSSSLNSYTQDIQTASASTQANLESLNIQESATNFLRRSHPGSFQEEFNPLMGVDFSMLQSQPQQPPHGTRNQMQQGLPNSQAPMFRAENFGARGVGGEEEDAGDIFTGLHIPFWASSSEHQPQPTTTRGMEAAAETNDESQLRDQSPVNEELLGDVIRWGVHW